MKSLAQPEITEADSTRNTDTSIDQAPSRETTEPEFEILVRIHEAQFDEDEKVSSIRRWVKFMVLEVALEFLDESNFSLDHSEDDTITISVYSEPDDETFEGLSRKFVELLRESTNEVVRKYSVLNYLSIAFIPGKT